MGQPGSRLSLADWHARFQEQAGWTASLRAMLFERVGANQAQQILEVGSGTGVLASELVSELSGERPQQPSAQVVGLDLDQERVHFAHQIAPGPDYLAGNGLRLPFADAAFDLVYCHYLLLWVPQPAAVLAEMRRVTRPGGWVLALAEPDYGSRIDYPAELEPLGRWQTQALQRQGADPFTGRRLAELFSGADLAEIEVGLLGGQWQPGRAASPAIEWRVLADDLAGQVDPGELARLAGLDRQAWQAGRRILFVPTFYALGQIPPSQP